MTSDETAIPLSRTKTLMGTIGSVVFVMLGIWLLISDSSPSHRHNPLFAQAIGVLSILFFGACSVVWAKKLFDRGPGITFCAEGITDTSSATAMGFIPWSDVQNFDTYKVMTTSFLVVKVFDPEKYIAQGGEVRQKLNRANMGLCGSPVTISSVALAISFDGLVQVFEKYFSKYGRTRD